MKFRAAYVTFVLLLSACAAAIDPPEPPRSTTPGPMPGGYVQFCDDNPESLLCKKGQ